LELEDAKNFAMHLCATNRMDIIESDVLYMLEQIEWYIPFYIQLIEQEIKRLYRRNPTINKAVNKAVIDEAIKKALANEKDFIHWKERLHTLSKKGRAYAKEILSLISKQDSATSSELSNLAQKHKLGESEAKKIISALVYDGYINNSIDAPTYRFNSPLLKKWWYNNVVN
jgi:hypothetical protein